MNNTKETLSTPLSYSQELMVPFRVARHLPRKWERITIPAGEYVTTYPWGTNDKFKRIYNAATDESFIVPMALK